MSRRLTRPEEDEIRRLKSLAREASDKALMKRFGVSRKTIYNALWRAEKRNREAMDSAEYSAELPALCTCEVS